MNTIPLKTELRTVDGQSQVTHQQSVNISVTPPFGYVVPRYCMQLCDQWTDSVGESSQYNLSQPIICRDQATSRISVNFNPQVTHNR